MVLAPPQCLGFCPGDQGVQDPLLGDKPIRWVLGVMLGWGRADPSRNLQPLPVPHASPPDGSHSLGASASGAAKHVRGRSLISSEGGRCVVRRAGRGAGSAEALFFSREARAVDMEAAARAASGIYEKFLKASRSKAMSSRRCSSVTWVFLLPVAGAAAGSRPAYHTGLARLMVVRSLGFT